MTEEKQHLQIEDLDSRSEYDFLVYANSVNRARAIPRSEDNLKPIHRKILYTFYKEKLTPDKNYAKSMATVGDVMKYFSPHGDSATYGALARLAQSWKLLYPLVDGSGNFGSLLDDKPAAARYTDARLSPIGLLMLEDINQNCVNFVPNYDESTTEPEVLPSKFPYILCGNNDGIGVSISSNVVSHNFTEVAAAIKYYLDHKDACTVSDLMKFIQGPDFPTGGRITNGEDLYQIYSTGHGVLKMIGHYDIVTTGDKPLIIFHDVPYGIQIEENVVKPLKDYVIKEDIDSIENITTKKIKKNRFDITFVCKKKANIAECLNLILSKTKLATSVKVNNVFVDNGEIKTLNLLQMVQSYVNNRDAIIKKIANQKYQDTAHKLTLILGLEKCTSDIDNVISIIRNADNNNIAKAGLMKNYALTDEQADAVLEIKLGKLSRLDIKDLHDKEVKYKSDCDYYNNLIENQSARYNVIKSDLDDIKKIVGEDKRQTEITFSKTPNDPSKETMLSSATKKCLYTYSDGFTTSKFDAYKKLVSVNYGYGEGDIISYNAAGECGVGIPNAVGSFNQNNGDFVICVTKLGNVKLSKRELYKFSNDKLLKIKEGDSLLYASTCSPEDTILLISTTGNKLLRLKVKDLKIGTKMTVGVKSGFDSVETAFVCTEKDDSIFMASADGKAKICTLKDIQIDNRLTKGQTIAENTKWIGICDMNKPFLCIVPKRGNNFTVEKEKMSIKSVTASGVSLTTRQIDRIL